MASKKQDLIVANNRKAFHDYLIMDKFEAGIELRGSEVKSLRENNCQLKDSFILVRRGEAWLFNVHIAPFKNAAVSPGKPDRRRRLLLHKKEIRKLKEATQEKGMAIVPLKVYFKAGYLVKVEIAVARGKKLHDKRQAIAKKTQMREAEQYLKARSH